MEVGQTEAALWVTASDSEKSGNNGEDGWLRHLVDRNSIVSLCDPSNQSTAIEIGAEIFSAELIYPEPYRIHSHNHERTGLSFWQEPGKVSIAFGCWVATP
jgi:hypothetical protein